MNRRDFLKISAAAAASLALGCSPGALFRRRPNLILIVSDTLRADHLRCYGSPLPLSPVVDALAGRGIVFADVTTSAPITGAAHATLMTGTYQTRHTVTDNFGHLRDDLVTLAEVLKNAKYETAAFVSSAVLKPEHVYGFARGFGLYNDELPAVERNRPDSYYTDARDTTAAAIEWVGRRHSAPFFLWVHYLEPHGPYEVPDPALLKEIRSVPQVPSEPRVLPLGADNYHPGGIPPYRCSGRSATQGSTADGMRPASGIWTSTSASFSKQSDG
jgi:arylsulfatase A-like enzyme